MTKALKIIGLADGRPTVHDGKYVTECDVDAREGRGIVYTIMHANEARKFDTTIEALEYWKRRSTVLPLRPDGQPNRPLTAYTVEVVDV